ncbi:uncharacterized protein LOC130140012 [Syzygium oleosum]|uniref:uncharacterized protein LOC130140012 n=1 Tax=Syzygium oleosum TaxID=219896 RepID=UPI0024BBAF6E|nr:uncharacterized protein LOC130140012 [Syzygium oleosum]
MGCASSKRTESKVDVYRPPPSSFAVFDINSIEEPWLLVDKSDKEPEKDGAPPAPDRHAPDGKPSHVPDPILQKLRTLESTESPQSWVEVSKALEDLKTAAAAAPPPPPPKPLPPSANNGAGEAAQRDGAPRKSVSFHTLEELDAKLSTKPAEQPLRKTESMRSDPRRKVESPVAAESRAAELRAAEPAAGFKSVKNNIFIVKDRLEREKEGKMANYDRMLLSKRDPLSVFPEKCPPRGEDSLVIYTTSMRGVRRTHEDCARARSILEIHRAVFDERDVALHGEFLSELREILGGEEGVAPGPVPLPRVFLKGRYLGGVEELVKLNETGRFGKLLAFAGVERGPGRLACEGCGGGRFVPCLDCGGSCKVVVEGRKERCGKCNENGLVHCPVCL